MLHAADYVSFDSAHGRTSVESSAILKCPVVPRLSTGSPKIEPELHRPPTQRVLPRKVNHAKLYKVF